ncbi:hypothetical protein [Flavobacterium caeni]|uniref:hypothetical protein n=1 Tax=Flavobacterium caeni TaxID=490189 RepID=UPI0011131612|nr:hypothetical protein [Flavobacterium caeni]
MDFYEIEKRPYLLIGVILILLLAYVDIDNFGLNKTFGFAYDLKNVALTLCLISLIISFLSHLVLAILKYRIASSISYTYVFSILLAITFGIYSSLYFLVFSFGFISIILMILSIIVAIKQGKDATSP